MCKFCDEKELTEVFEDSEELDTENARELFMAVLEASEPEVLSRYKDIEERFMAMVDLVREAKAAGRETDETWLTQGDLLLAEMGKAKEELDRSFHRVSYKINHAAFA